VSTFIAIYANSWAAEQMMVQGNGDPATAAGPAIFVAPFTEEFSKATILFFLAILARNRLVSRLQIISLAGLSAAGFAFTENILYYMRAFLYASTTMETGPDAEAATLELVWLRGFFTAFGHPLFTMMTALGLVVGLRAKSRTVRVVAPLAGFLSAALLHMLFNGTVTVMDEQGRMNMYYWGALPMVGFAILTVILASFEQGRLIRSRLTDYVRMGWLQFQDPVSTGRQWLRFKANLAAWLMGWTAIVSTLKLQRRLTELAYLRDAMTRGLIDRHGATREEELLGEIRALRPTAIDDPARTRLRWGWTGRRKRADFAPPTTYPGPAGIGGNWPAPGSSVQMDAPPARSAPPQQFPPPSGRPFGS
jgi:RsiW-degrading membrane proteinase PrsW (M82 family)